ncbi:cyanophycinase [Leucobacter komagatae]|uniref:Cyanophycinase n=1 Tax=Leucobacter komagatae TaxID=55969 RepID=A0A0D0IL06_9MICO|nr:cyanophycinase [Leucobacter komagatae]KIP51797.1 hypothetical protein SD72_13160 [Leucobacter komagatae]
MNTHPRTAQRFTASPSVGAPGGTDAAHLAPNGHLVLIGGALDESPEILTRIIELAGARRGTRAPRIAILTTASEPATSAEAAQDPTTESDEADGRYYAELFERHGAVGVPIPIGASAQPAYPGSPYSRATASQADTAELIRGADGVFLGGGDQTNYVLALFTSSVAGEPPFGARTDTPALTAIREVLALGGVVAGTSAGLAVQQGADMVSGGADIHNAWKHGATPGYDIEREGRDALTHVPAGGLGLFPEALLDSHFSEWARPPRSIRLARALGRSACVGVDEHTALVYDRATRTSEVIGMRGVSLLNFDGCEGAGDTIIGTRWSYLVPGDSHDFASGTTKRGDMLADLELPLAPAAGVDLWADDGSRPLLTLAQSLLASPELAASGESSVERHPGYRTTLRRDERTLALPTGGFSDLIISITPISTTH